MNFSLPWWVSLAGLWAFFRFTFWDGPRQLYRCVRRHPKLWALALAFAGLTALVGFRNAAFALYLSLLALPWRIVHRESYDRWMSGPLRSDWRRWYRYQRSWPDVMSLNRLSEVIDNGLDVHPEIVKVRCTDRTIVWQRWPLKRTVSCTDTLWIRALISQDLEDYQDRARTLATDFGARSGRAVDEPGRPKGCVRLELAYGPDPLAETIPALPIPATVDEIDFSAVPLGRTEKGEPWTIGLELAVLLAGATGSGKSGVLQQLIRSLAPAIRDRLVIVHAVDPKFGLEFGPTSKMFEHYEDDDPEAMVKLLENAAAMMEGQSRSLKLTGARKNRPTLERPLHLVVVDEMIDLTDPRGPDKALAARVRTALGLLLRKGRAAGFIVIGACTDPRIEAVPMKNGFPTRIGMRLKTPLETKMILGDGARLRGARCEDIRADQRGVGYALLGDEVEATRVRAAYVTNDDIAAMVAEYAPGPRAVPAADPPEFDFDGTADEDGPVLELVQGDLVSDEGWE